MFRVEAHPNFDGPAECISAFAPSADLATLSTSADNPMYIHILLRLLLLYVLAVLLKDFRLQLGDPCGLSHLRLVLLIILPQSTLLVQTILSNISKYMSNIK